MFWVCLGRGVDPLKRASSVIEELLHRQHQSYMADINFSPSGVMGIITRDLSHEARVSLLPRAKLGA